MRRLVVSMALVAGSISASFAADSPWVGTWKLDMSKSNFTGSTFTYSKLPDGMMHVSNGADFSFDFAFDGKQYKVIADRTLSATKTGKDAWDEVFYGSGKELGRSHSEISSDGKTLTSVSTGTKPDGTTYRDTSVSTRVSGSSGLEGKWRSTKIVASSPDIAIASAPADGTLRWETPAYHSVFEGKTDGSDLPLRGPTVPPGMLVTMKATAPGVLAFSSKIDGKVVGYDVQTLSPPTGNPIRMFPGARGRSRRRRPRCTSSSSRRARVTYISIYDVGFGAARLHLLPGTFVPVWNAALKRDTWGTQGVPLDRPWVT